jgi:hypothetical protein
LWEPLLYDKTIGFWTLGSSTKVLDNFIVFRIF